MNLPDALANRIREACGDGLLLDARQGRGIIADWRSVPDMAQRLKLCGYTRCVDYTLYELPAPQPQSQNSGGGDSPPFGYDASEERRRATAATEQTVFQFHLTLRAPEHGHAALWLKWKYTLDASDPQPFPTLSRIWPSAGLAEREILEMYGLPFSGNERLTPLLLDETFAGHPLRRDYAPPAWPNFAAALLRQRHEAALLAGLHSTPTAGAGRIPPSSPASTQSGIHAAHTDGGAQ